MALEIDKIRKAAHEEAMSSLQETLQERLAVEQKKWDEQNQITLEQAKAPLARALEAQKTLAANLEAEAQRAELEIQTLREQVKALEVQKTLATKLEAEGRRAEQDIHMLREQMKALAAERDTTARSLKDEKATRENQTRQFMQRIAEMQMRESALREEMERQDSGVGDRPPGMADPV